MGEGPQRMEGDDMAVRDELTRMHGRWRMCWHNCSTRSVEGGLMPPAEALVEFSLSSSSCLSFTTSGLWPFSTLGWPDEHAPDFQRFYPTSVLETG